MSEDLVPAIAHRVSDTTIFSPMSEYEKKLEDIIEPVHDEVIPVEDEAVMREMRNRLLLQYGRSIADDDIAPASDITLVLDKLLEMSDEEALEIVVNAIDFHRLDPNFPSATMEKLKVLSTGYKEAQMSETDWSFDVRAEAAILHYHSPYPEVRAVTQPFDDPDAYCETPRAYFLGLCFMAGATGLNTFFSPRQPSIGIGANVLQLLLVPCGMFLAKVLPDWTIAFPKALPFIGGCKWALNPGPWSFKEQMFATILFTVASSAGGTYYVYLVQLLPQYLDQTWVVYGYEILLAMSVQFLGFGFAGILRRFVIYPVNAIWPSILPTLALNRALLLKEKKETINGWRISRYRFFFICFSLMFVWFWVPNTLFGAIRLFNWMTWIAPNNFTLGMITGSYGGMGFNPWSTFDWNVSGSSYLVTPFFSAVQQYSARVLSGLIIIAMYWGNYYWSAYMPINSNESFDNTGNTYNVSRIMGNDGYIDVDKYKAYGPPYFSGANVFGQGAWFAWYTMALFYITIRNWTSMKATCKAMWRTLRRGGSVFDGHDDAHSRMMKRYPETPEWWFFVVVVISFVLGVAALTAYPTHTPWYALLGVIGLNAVFLIPAALMVAAANVSLTTGVLFQLLGGVWFAGNPQAQIIMQAYGSNFQSSADTYLSDQKLAHYAKLPPRAIFRGQMLSVFLNCFIFISILNWMVTSFNNGTLCTWENEQHFVCTDAVLVYASAVQYGAFGVRNFFRLYPIFPWCFLIGALIGISWATCQKYGPTVRAACYRRFSETEFYRLDKFLFHPLSYLAVLDPAVTWAGALNWTGGNNLTYATNGLYISFIFMYYIKRRYTAWWEKYNYLIEAGFDVGVAISGIVQTLIFAFGNGGQGITIDWWGNNVGTQGQDYQSYIQNSTLLPIPEKGYFGLEPDHYPMSW